MISQPTTTGVLRVCACGALISLLVTAIVPVLFFRFPGSTFIPLRYEWMWAVTEILWKPLRILQLTSSPLISYDLRQHANPYLVAPLVNAPLAFTTVFVFLKLRDMWQRGSPKAVGGPELQSVIDHIEGIRTDYPAALHEVPHPAKHAEAVMDAARTKVKAEPYFGRTTELDASQEEDHHD